MIVAEAKVAYHKALKEAADAYVAYSTAWEAAKTDKERATAHEEFAEEQCRTELIKDEAWLDFRNAVKTENSLLRSPFLQ